MFEVKIKQLSAAKEDTDKKVIENETKIKMTANQPHGETTNVTEQTSSRSTSSQKRRSSKQQQGRHPEGRRVGDAAELKFLQPPRCRRRRLRRAWRLRSRIRPEPEFEVSSTCGKYKGRRQ